MDGLNPVKKSASKNPAQKKVSKSVGKSMPQKNSLLSNILAVVITAVIVGGAIYVWQDRSNDERLSEIERNAKNVRDGYDRSLKNLENENRKASEEVDKLLQEKEDLESKVKLVEGAVKKYENEELGITFSYPAILGNLIYEKKAGQAGEKFIARFDNNPSFVMAGVSEDYIDSENSTSTETNFEDFIRIDKNRDEYSYLVRYMGETVEYALEPLEVIDFSDGEALLVDKNSFLGEPGTAAIGIGENLGALISTDKEGFSGIAMLNSDFGRLSPESFRELLKSIEIK